MGMENAGGAIKVKGHGAEKKQIRHWLGRYSRKRATGNHDRRWPESHGSHS